VFATACTTQQGALISPYDGAVDDIELDMAESAPGGGMPCDVEQLVADKCLSCHSDPPRQNAPMALVTRDDFLAPSKSDPQKTNGELAVERMKNSKYPMPPDGKLATSLVNVIADWVQSGMPAETCVPSEDDMGHGVGYDLADPFNTPTVCTSGTHWTNGDHGDSKMHPGRACIDCHSKQFFGPPTFTLAGTIFPTGHDPDDCNGDKSLGIQIIVTDANGKMITMTPNTAGNFYYKNSVAKPYHAKVVYNGVTRAMSAAQTSGDCNSCHTEKGANMAPGRIMTP
jgi:hypothetical protein